MAQEWKFRNSAALWIWNELINEVWKIKERYNKGIFSKQESLKLLNKELKVIFNFLVARDSQGNIMKEISNWKWFLWVPLAKLGINNRVMEFWERNLTSTDILEWNADDFIDEISADFLESNSVWTINLDDWEFFKAWLEPVKDETKNKIKNTLPENEF